MYIQLQTSVHYISENALASLQGTQVLVNGAHTLSISTDISTLPQNLDNSELGDCRCAIIELFHI